jgi:hypothetical protein
MRRIAARAGDTVGTDLLLDWKVLCVTRMFDEPSYDGEEFRRNQRNGS